MRFVPIVLLVVACKGDEKAAPLPAPASGSSTAGSGSALATSGGGSGSAAPAPPPPLDPRVKAARCDEPCLFLTDTPLDKLDAAFQTECKTDMPDLELTDCKKLDVIRKCVFAAHGFVFKSKLWKKAYETKSWYVANPTFRPTQINAVELANVTDLDARAKACKKGITISPADVKLVQGWLAGVDKRKPTLPKIVQVNRKAGTADELLDTIKDELSGMRLKKITLGGDGNTVSYELPEELPEELRDELPLKADAKRRSIRIEQSTTNSYPDAGDITEGLEIRLIYDDHDQLLAVSAQHFLWD